MDNIELDKKAQYNRDVLELAMDAGHILLENGAEVYRVEETMKRISNYYGVEFGNFFVLTNGIFAAGGHEADGQYARVKHIPVHPAHFEKVIAANSLSRDIAEGKYPTVEAAREELNRIRSLPNKRPVHLAFAYAIGSGTFAYLFGGSLVDALIATLAGFILYFFVTLANKNRMSKIVSNALGGGIVTIVCMLFKLLGVGDNFNFMIIGAIMPLIPGLAFTNGIRDIGNGDYISGSVRLLDAILVFVSIAIGVGTVLSVYNMITGGAML